MTRTAEASQVLRQRATTAVIAVVAIVAIAGGVAARKTYDLAPSAAPAATTPVGPAFPPVLTVRSVYGQEAGPLRQQWTWIGTDGQIGGPGIGQYIALRAFSHQRARRLTIGGRTVPVGREPAPLVVGPIDAPAPGTSVPVSVSPGPDRAGGNDPRRISVMLTSAVTGPTPLFALPGPGVYPRQQDAEGPFHWLGRRSSFDIVAADASAPVNVRIVLRSAIRREIVVRVTGQGKQVVRRLQHPGGGQDRTAEVKGVHLVRNQGRIAIGARGKTITSGGGPAVFAQVRAVSVTR